MNGAAPRSGEYGEHAAVRAISKASANFITILKPNRCRGALEVIADGRRDDPRHLRRSAGLRCSGRTVMRALELAIPEVAGDDRADETDAECDVRDRLIALTCRLEVRVVRIEHTRWRLAWRAVRQRSVRRLGVIGERARLIAGEHVEAHAEDEKRGGASRGDPFRRREFLRANVREAVAFRTDDDRRRVDRLLGVL